MKKIRKYGAVFMLLIMVTGANAQITFPLELGQGFKWKDYQNPQWYLFNMTVNPTVGVLNNKAALTTVGMTTYCDGEVDLYGGPQISGKIYEAADQTFNVQVKASALFGSGGKKLFGGGVNLEFVKMFYISINARQEYEYKELWFDAGLGISFIKLN